MQMKQTSIDFLEEFLKQYDCAHSSLDYYELKIPMHIFDKKIGQAKEMEKEQMIDFARSIIIDATCSVEGYVTTEKDIEEYYNETFNKQ
jgi:hypothetical protein